MTKRLLPPWTTSTDIVDMLLKRKDVIKVVRFRFCQFGLSDIVRDSRKVNILYLHFR